MIRDLIELFQILGSERSRQREKMIGFLESASHEFDSLANCWSEIATHFAAEEVSAQSVRAKLREQRGHFESLCVHLDGATSGLGEAVSKRNSMLEPLEIGLTAKGDLYGVVRRLLGDDSSIGESKTVIEPIPSSVTNKIAYLRDRRQASASSSNIKPEERARAIRGLQLQAEDLCGLAGTFRAEVARFRASTPII